MPKLVFWLASLYALVCTINPACGKIIYVKVNANGAKNGSSWANAYTSLSPALKASESGDEIWVAAGTYKPTLGTDRNTSFVMTAGVGLYGGFAGNETLRSRRNWLANATVLSGDIGTADYERDNCKHVICGASGATLDGFTVSGGYGDRCWGAGMYNDHLSTLTLANCQFKDNMTTATLGGRADGAAIFSNALGTMTISQCIFSNDLYVSPNYSQPYLYGSVLKFSEIKNLTLNECRFEGYSGSYRYYSGEEGLSADHFGKISISGCTFSGHDNMKGLGVDLRTTNGTTIEIHHSNFAYFGLTIQRDAAFYGRISHCTFSNVVVNYYNGIDDFAVTDSSFDGSCLISNGAVSNCTFKNSLNNAASLGGSIDHCTFTNNGNVDNGASCVIQSRGATISDCVFSGNKNSCVSGWGTIARCLFIGNQSNFGSVRSKGITISNSVFVGNVSVPYGGGVCHDSGGGLIVNCTFWGNRASHAGGAIYNSGASSVVCQNCIMWDDTAPVGPEIYNDQSNPTFMNCDIKGCGGSGAGWLPSFGSDLGGNIDRDPLFANTALPQGADEIWFTTDDGLELLKGSPCIDAGMDKDAPITDVLGKDRVIRPDIGAYESPLTRNSARNWEFYR